MFLKRISGKADWLVVFLGNPGGKYADTRHNVGFMAAEKLEKQENIKISRLKFSSLTAHCHLGGQKALLIKPQTYMNLSGNAVAPAAAYFKIPPERILVVCDDTALPVGRLRIRAKGSSGGHNGLKSIISALGTENFPRIKIGVGAPVSNETEEAMANWVLSAFSRKEALVIDEICAKAAEAILMLLNEGIEKAMNHFN